jgi:hypothetical protein
MVNYSKLLPGGRYYQKSGNRLELAIYNYLPNSIKKNITKNYKLKNSNGNVLVEYDMLYENNNNIISFEIKGINNKTSFNKHYFNKIIKQAERQVKYLDIIGGTKKKLVIYCLVTGDNYIMIDNDINPKLLDELTKMNILLCVGTTPNICINNIHSILVRYNLLN